MNNLPYEILNHIKPYIRYDIMHKLCIESNEGVIKIS